LDIESIHTPSPSLFESSPLKDSLSGTRTKLLLLRTVYFAKLVRISSSHLAGPHSLRLLDDVPCESPTTAALPPIEGGLALHRDSAPRPPRQQPTSANRPRGPLSPEEKSKRIAEGRCLYCGELGHKWIECPKVPAKRKSTPATGRATYTFTTTDPSSPQENQQTAQEEESS